MRISKAGSLVPIAVISLLAACASSHTAQHETPPGSSQQVAAAQQALTQVQAAPTKIALTVPLNTTPPSGETFVMLLCEQSQCSTARTAAAAATAAIGWNLKILNYNSANPATLITAMNQALQYHPVAVGFFGLPQAVWSQEIPIYQKAGVIMTPMAVGPATRSATVPAIVNTEADQQRWAKAIANWFIADSGATGKALVFTVPEYPILSTFTTTFQSSVATSCSACSVKELRATIAEVEAGQTNALIVSALQKDPAIKYVVTAAGVLTTGLPSALSAAGLSVKIAGSGATAADEVNILQGKESAFIPYPQNYGVWAMIDVATRHLEGMTIAPDAGGLPLQLLTKASMSGITPSDSFDYPTDFPQQFKALWKIR
jgi:ribose transport system substrate-binding protein